MTRRTWLIICCMAALGHVGVVCAQQIAGTLPGGQAWSQDRQRVYRNRQQAIRNQLRQILVMPGERGELAAEFRGLIELEHVVIEKWVFLAEPGSRIPCLLYRPSRVDDPLPAVVLTYGHGSSKSHWAYQYAGQLYARLGVACLAMDPLGEEERNSEGRRGTRAHDRLEEACRQAGRPVFGKMVFDATRGIDFLLEREDIDSARIGVAGNSLGGTVAQFTAAVEPRLRLVLVSGWMYDAINTDKGKMCTRIPSRHAAAICDWDELLALVLPQAALLTLNGTADVIIERRPPNGDEPGGAAWSGNHLAVAAAKEIAAGLGREANWIDEWYEPGGGHRPYFLSKIALEWIHRHLGTPAMSLDQIRHLPTVNSGRWCDANQLKLERLYGTELHQRGLTLPDVGIRAVPENQLAVLREEEQGQPEFTLRGWLEFLGRENAAPPAAARR